MRQLQTDGIAVSLKDRLAGEKFDFRVVIRRGRQSYVCFWEHLSIFTYYSIMTDMLVA